MARRAARCTLLAAACMVGDVKQVAAQQAQPSHSDVSRATLESLAVVSERRATKADRDRAAAIRERLQRGDFATGDQLILEIEGGEKPFSDTVSVRTGQVIRVEGFPDIPLRGVLRSEARDHLTRELKRYLIAPRVTVRPLVRLTVTGGVARPGFYVVPYDQTITDVVMDAGGPTTNAKIERTEVRRGERTLHRSQSLAAALREGRTLDELGVMNGDVINVGTRRSFNTGQVFQVVGLAVSLITIAATLSRR